MDWDSGIDTISGALVRIPWEVWHVDRAKLLARPSFRDIGDTPERYSPGAFMTLMGVAGLNNYNLPREVKADVGYWHPFWRQVIASTIPSDPKELESILEPFYRTQPEGRQQKVPRLRKFCFSQLARELWCMEPDQVKIVLPELWCRFASTMDQDRYRKTIAYAPKTIGNALHILGLDSFNYSGIPIPSDYRLGKLTPCLKEPYPMSANTQDMIQQFWAEVLECLQSAEPRVLMYHLDTFLWTYVGQEELKLTWLESQGISRQLSEQIIAAFESIRGVEPR